MMEFLLSAGRTSSENASAAGAYLIMGLAVMAIYILLSVLLIIAMIKLYRKIGVSPWVIFIPIYSSYVFFKAFGVRKWFWITAVLYAALFGTAYLAAPYFENSIAVPIILYVMVCVFFVLIAIGTLHYTYNMARAFGKGFSFFCGLLILNPIFYLILAFGKSEYVGVPD